MKPEERKQIQKQIEDAIRSILGDHFISVDFCYYRGGRGIVVTYEDFKPEAEVKEEITKVIEGRWRIITVREFSNENIMHTMLGIYKENRVAVVDQENGELKPYTVQAYVNRMMSQKYFS